MKKTYIVPSIEVMQIKGANLLTASNPGVYTTPVDPGSAGSRECDFDYEEDY